MLSETGNSWVETGKGLDRIMLILVLILFALGLLSIYSAGAGVRKLTTVYAMKQALWGALSAVAYAAVLKIGYQNFFSEHRLF